MLFARRLSRSRRLMPAVIAGLLSCAACSRAPSPLGFRKMIVLGVDGMDPGFLEKHIAELPNLNRLGREGEFRRLATTVPPQSPVAWSSFITGMDPGGHGVFDFLHRDPRTRLPFSSMAEATGSKWSITIGRYVIPLSGGRVRLLRNGNAFWQILSSHGIPATIIRMPNNFPPVGGDCRALSGMGTPDLQGTYGTFSYYTDDPAEERTTVAGGTIKRVRPVDGCVVLDIGGPVDTFLKDRPIATVRLAVHLDPGQHAARCDAVGGGSLVLREGEWSDWVRVRFAVMHGLRHTSGMFRLFLREVAPVFRLYVSPVNIDPLDPALPISTPPSLSRELAESLGLYYTLGTAEDTSALRAGVLDHHQYLAQSRLVLGESLRMFRHELNRFQTGLFFYYFSILDQNSHILWGRYEAELLEFYEAVDEAVGEAAAKAGGNGTLIVMSDHGFAPFERAVNLNTWLLREGYLALDNPQNTGPEEMFAHVDWTRTKAYAIGLNALYLNVKGREEGGIIEPGRESEELLDSLTKRLKTFRDPDNGELVIRSAGRPSAVYRGKNLAYAPDLIIGYAPGFRASWQTALGGVPDLTVEDNNQAWIADHCIAAEAVPGVFLSNRKGCRTDPVLWDLPATILSEFGIPAPEGMMGRPLFTDGRFQ